MILKPHFLKDWELPVNIWFNQQAYKICKHEARQAKVGCDALCPATGPIRPGIKGPVVTYHSKDRASRDFSLGNSGWLISIQKAAPTAFR